MEEQTKTCSKCGKDLPLSSFYKHLSKPDGLTYDCKSCRLLHRKKYRMGGTNRHREWALGTISRHRKNGYEIILNSEQLTEIARETSHCKWCGRKLNWEVGKGFIDTNPTLDRINCDDYLDIDNVEGICHSCNVSKGHRTEKEFRQYIKGMYEMTFYGCKGKDK